ncbi:MAG: extracellular solute-binding protein [Candidatus Brocadiaceae bacterium]|nr:extracellular solute-binding protein [Candidatus Brocadiaceae bacterium]
MRSLWIKLRRYPALLLLVTVYLASTAVVATNILRGRSGAPGQGRKTILRFAHWQLEPGIRSAIDDLIADYTALHPDVEVRQILIPEQGYFQWVNTQLIGRTAPDMIEVGSGGAVGWSLWPKFYARYFLPLDRYVDEPNPYNAGTPLEGVPWRQAFFDEMEGGYSEELQSFFRVPIATSTVRLFYNRDLVRKVWDGPFPETFEDLTELCDRLKAWGEEQGVIMEPIAGSWYNFRQFFNTYRTALTADYLDRLDRDFNGTVSRIESAAPLYSGAVRMDEPALQGNFALIQELAEYFAPGFTALGRDEAVFLFLQGQSAMITTGTWDFEVMRVQAEFDLAVAEIPLPSPSHPRYGALVAGPTTEAGLRGGFPMGVIKDSPNVETTLDFLRFATSLEANEKLNRTMSWLPVAEGARLAEHLQPFAPLIEGYASCITYDAPGAELAFEQTFKELLGGKIDYRAFVESLMAAYDRELPGGVASEFRNGEQTLSQQIRFAALRRAALAGAVGAEKALTADSQAQYQRIMEAYVVQLGTRHNDIRVWIDSVAAKP